MPSCALFTCLLSSFLFFSIPAKCSAHASPASAPKSDPSLVFPLQNNFLRTLPSRQASTNDSMPTEFHREVKTFLITARKYVEKRLLRVASRRVDKISRYAELIDCSISRVSKKKFAVLAVVLLPGPKPPFSTDKSNIVLKDKFSESLHTYELIYTAGNDIDVTQVARRQLQLRFPTFKVLTAPKKMKISAQYTAVLFNLKVSKPGNPKSSRESNTLTPITIMVESETSNRRSIEHKARQLMRADTPEFTIKTFSINKVGETSYKVTMFGNINISKHLDSSTTIRLPGSHGWDRQKQLIYDSCGHCYSNQQAKANSCKKLVLTCHSKGGQSQDVLENDPDIVEGYDSLSYSPGKDTLFCEGFLTNFVLNRRMNCNMDVGMEEILCGAGLFSSMEKEVMRSTKDGGEETPIIEKNLKLLNGDSSPAGRLLLDLEVSQRKGTGKLRKVDGTMILKDIFKIRSGMLAALLNRRLKKIKIAKISNSKMQFRYRKNGKSKRYGNGSGKKSAREANLDDSDEKGSLEIFFTYELTGDGLPDITDLGVTRSPSPSPSVLLESRSPTPSPMSPTNDFVKAYSTCLNPKTYGSFYTFGYTWAFNLITSAVSFADGSVGRIYAVFKCMKQDCRTVTAGEHLNSQGFLLSHVKTKCTYAGKNSPGFDFYDCTASDEQSSFNLAMRRCS